MSTGATESSITIRVPQTRDHGRLAELAGQLGYSSAGDEIARRLAGMQGSPDHAVFLAETPEGRIAGWIGVFLYRCVEADARAEISGLIVDERMRSKGIGNHLLERAEEWAREKGCLTASVRSNVIRERAHTFYERNGYKHIKTQKAFRKTL
ncbi:MAG TPA: GNAT family N-acetyltransferase [Candidatus Acidoferrales bacterium]|nr:GNAT family N-acetyltransferase [Candidatus Acidoferrales bacterium]